MSISRNSGVLFTMYRGDDKSYNVVVADDQKAPVNITGWVFRSTMKLQLSDTDDEAPVKVDVSGMSGVDAEAGRFTLILPSNQTTNLEAGLYHFDLQVEQNNLVSTIIEGKVRVFADVTQRSA